MAIAVLGASAFGPPVPAGGPVAAFALAQTSARVESGDGNDFLVVDCLLPGKVRRLGRRQRYITPRRPMRTTAIDCQIRGGEYTEFDRASYQTALAVWLPEAQAGSAEAQYFVGQIYERGLGLDPDYPKAAGWYRRAADQGHAEAQTSLAYLYEMGLGVARDPAAALNLYRAAAGLAADLIVLDSVEYQRLLELEQAVAAKTAELVRLDDRRAQLQRELVSARQGAGAQAQRTDELAGLISGLERELLAGRQVIGGLTEQVADLERKLAAETAAQALAPVPATTPKTVVAVAKPIKPAAAVPAVDYGPYQALVIANGDYLNLPDMAEAKSRGESMAKLLEQRYGFRVERLVDASRYQVLAALNRLRETLTEKHNLLIYYFGHSASDAATQRSWWQPVDAEPESRANWISSRVLSDHLELIPAKHVLVVADAAFSGVLTRSAVPRLPQGMSDTARAEHIREMLDHRVRLVLSADSAAAPDDGSFSTVLLQVLEDNHKVVEASEIYRQLSVKIAATASAPPVPIPVFAPIRWAGASGGGDFFFVPRSGRE